MKRIYIYHQSYSQIINYAKTKFETENKRTKEGKPLYKSFAQSLEEYLNERKNNT